MQQAKPSQDPPERVLVGATLYVHNLRDDDNLRASLKYVLDALRQKQAGRCAWRCGVSEWAGYFVDDDPAHLTLGPVTQELDRGDPRIVLTIEWRCKQ